MNTKTKKTGAIILAAGKGKRMNSGTVNKNSILLNGKPLILYPVELLDSLQVTPIVIVIGHASESVRAVLAGADVIFAKQSEQLGTGHAVLQAMPFIDDTVTDILIVYGDDSYLYTKDIIKNLMHIHEVSDSALTFLTISVDNPTGLGRIMRDATGEVFDIIEEKDATDAQKNIKEINPNCYIFKADFLRKYITKIQKSQVTGEYYLPALIKLARGNGERLKAVDGGKIAWRGINTPEDLADAANLFTK